MTVLRRALARALRLRCPNCGASGFFETWFRVVKACRTCGFNAQRFDEGYVMGALALNMVVSEMLALGAALSVVLTTWPDPPWNVVTYGGLALAIGLPFAFYPLSKSLFIALNHYLGVADMEPAARRRD